MKTNQKVGSIDPKKPHAWVVNPGDKGRKAIKSNSKVYLEDGQNFEIELYNPLTESVLADIKVNGSSVSKSGLVLRPGERFYLDCFIDDKKKFVFNTYEVENTDQSKEAIQKNGIVEVFFYKEETIDLKNWRDRFQPTIERHYYPVYYPWYRPQPWYPSIWYGSTGTTISTFGGGTLNDGIIGSTTTTNAYYSNTNLNNASFTNTSSYATNNVSFSNSVETGRVEKGEASDQKFESVDMDFQKYHISSVIYQILPESQKPVETKEIKKSKKQKIKDLESQLEDLKKMVEKLTTKK